jgi:hypothetical protein
VGLLRDTSHQLVPSGEQEFQYGRLVRLSVAEDQVDGWCVLSLNESLLCNWFKPLGSQHDISDQFTLSKFPMRAIVSLRHDFTIPLPLAHSFFMPSLLGSEHRTRTPKAIG